jgi:hypothetical protein
MRSARTGTPFLYLLRDHQDATPEMLVTANDSIDDELVSTVILAGPSYEHNNQLLFNHLRGWLREGPAWSFMQLHARSMNGRAAFFAVKAQAEGQAALTSKPLDSLVAPVFCLTLTSFVTKRRTMSCLLLAR